MGIVWLAHKQVWQHYLRHKQKLAYVFKNQTLPSKHLHGTGPGISLTKCSVSMGMLDVTHSPLSPSPNALQHTSAWHFFMHDIMVHCWPAWHWLSLRWCAGRMTYGPLQCAPICLGHWAQVHAQWYRNSTISIHNTDMPSFIGCPESKFCLRVQFL